MDLFSYLLGKKSGGGSSGGLDWSAIGYNDMPPSVTDEYDYAIQIKNNWSNIANLSEKFINNNIITIMPLVDTSNATTMNSMFSTSTISQIPLLNTSNVTNMGAMFLNCVRLKRIPLLDTGKVEVIRNMFYGCKNLVDVPIFDTKSVSGTNSFNNMFYGCTSLSDESLNNILKMCINAISYNETKTLALLGFSSSNYPASKIQALSNYADFISAGWSIGY